jgi:hypothetical protein
MSEAVTQAKAALARGDLIAAYDLTMSAIGEGDESSEVRHLQILALARMGDTERAMDLFTAHGLDRSADPHERAAGARLLKDRALALADGAGRCDALSKAFEAYHAIYLESGDAFPGINAATLALLAGEEKRAGELAAALLADPVVAAAGHYYSAATKAEALLILGCTEEVAQVLGAAICDGRDYGRSGTARSWRWSRAMPGWRRPRAGPAGAAFAPRVAISPATCSPPTRPPKQAPRGFRPVARREAIGFAHGASCGADLLFAEAALARGVELHVVLPFDEDDFLAQSVMPGGETWVDRYRACMAQAASTTLASQMEFFGDPSQYG